MKMSHKGLDLLKKDEDLKLQAYKDPGSVNGLPITIGWGSTRKLDGSRWKLGDTITREEAVALLLRDTKDAEWAVNHYVKVPLTQNQFDALVSLAFNIGGAAFADSTLVKKLNSGDYTGAANQFIRWKFNDGKEMSGLLARRYRERDRFNTPDSVPPAAPRVEIVRRDTEAPVQAPAPQVEVPEVIQEPEVITQRPNMGIGNWWQAIQAGWILFNAATWKRRQIAVNALVALLTAGLGIASSAGYHVNVSDEDLFIIASVLFIVVNSLFNIWATTATTTKVGVPGVGKAAGGRQEARSGTSTGQSYEGPTGGP